MKFFHKISALWYSIVIHLLAIVGLYYGSRNLISAALDVEPVIEIELVEMSESDFDVEDAPVQVSLPEAVEIPPQVPTLDEGPITADSLEASGDIEFERSEVFAPDFEPALMVTPVFDSPSVPAPKQAKIEIQAVLKKNQPRIVYPYEARRDSLEGTVRVKVKISKEGKVVKADISSSSGHKILDDTALDYAYKAEFTPALSDGAPIESENMLPFKFQLKQKQWLLF